MPRLLGAVPLDKWEREIRRELQRQLPDEWIVVCNVAWALPDDRGVVRDGQCDFVVLVPNLGMVILEVKGSRSVRVADDGRWYRYDVNNRTGETVCEVPIDEPPPEQACRNMHALARIACDKLKWSAFPGAYAFVVAYPQGVVDAPHAMYDATTIITRDQMPRLTGALRDALRSRQPKPRTSFTTEVAGKLATFYSGDGFRIRRVDTPLDVREDAHDAELLTRQQYAAVRGAFDLPAVAVLGPAGSGKTMLALWKLEALLEEGQRALYVCYNKALAARLCATNASITNSIRSVDAFFAEFTKQPKGGETDEAYFSETVPNAVMDASANLPEDLKYDAIIVDEAQDFGEHRLIALQFLLRSGAQWLVFADQAQDVYRRGISDIPGTEVTFRLFHNCRNTELVNTATNRYCDQRVSSMPGVPRGVLPQVIKCNNETIMASRAWELAHQLSPEGGAVLLSPYRLENSCMAQARTGYGLSLSENIGDIEKTGFIFFSTIRSFKGLEAKSVVLLHADVPGLNPGFMPEDLYVACTRATSRLVILTRSSDAFDLFSNQGSSASESAMLP